MNDAQIILINRWDLASPKRGVAGRWRAREKKHGPLIVLPASEFYRLLATANTNAIQLHLDFDLRQEELYADAPAL